LTGFEKSVIGAPVAASMTRPRRPDEVISDAIQRLDPAFVGTV
jgi:hypothetical protein